MSDIHTKKLLILYILDILQKYTDEEHRLSQKEIQDILKKEYEMPVDRKAIKRNLLNLIEYGSSIEYREVSRKEIFRKKSVVSDEDSLDLEDKGIQEDDLLWTDFYLKQKFTNEELRLLIDSLLFSKHIPYSQAKKLITKLESLHYIESAGAPLLHKEFLAESGENPLRAIAEALCRDIPMNVCVTAYNKSFECSRIKELAGMFPDLAEHLLNIRDNIKDLLDPFQAGNYYNRAMGGSFSIKSVLPAIFPNDPELNYHNLEGVHNGSEAMTIFPRIKDMPAEEQKKARHNLLKYCELDTYAMVKVWGELVRVVKGDTEDGD